MTERLHFHFSLSCIGEGNGNPLQCSCLENPRDGGAWWAAVYGVTHSRTRLKWLSIYRSGQTGVAKVKIDILGISELKWTGMGEFNSNDHYISYCGQESLRRNGIALIVNQRVRNAVLGCSLKNDRMISVCFQGKPFSITVIQVCAPTSNAEEAEVEWFYEDLQDLLELTHKKDVLFIIGDWNAKVGSQEIPWVIGTFGLGVRKEAGQRLTEFCQENALVIANNFFQ